MFCKVVAVFQPPRSLWSALLKGNVFIHVIAWVGVGTETQIQNLQPKVHSFTLDSTGMPSIRWAAKQPLGSAALGALFA